MEIERKYLLKQLPADNLDSYEHVEIEQGYLCRKPAFRIRKKGDKYIFTYKGKGQKVDGVICNDEVEREIPEEAYLTLRTKVEGRMIEKTRYLIPLEDELVCELDIFKGVLSGLIFAEVEFPSVEAADHFCKPDWFGDNVSDDKRYSNSYLSTLNRLEEM